MDEELEKAIATCNRNGYIVIRSDSHGGDIETHDGVHLVYTFNYGHWQAYKHGHGMCYHETIGDAYRVVVENSNKENNRLAMEAIGEEINDAV